MGGLQAGLQPSWPQGFPVTAGPALPIANARTSCKRDIGQQHQAATVRELQLSGREVQQAAAASETNTPGAGTLMRASMCTML